MLKKILTLAAAVFFTVCTGAHAMSETTVLKHEGRTIVIEKVIPEVMSLSAYERRQVLCMSVAMLFEGDNRNRRDLESVGHVIMTRAEKRTMRGDDPCTVVYSGEFTFVREKARRVIKADHPVWPSVQKLALEIYRNPHRRSPVGDATHYYNPSLLRQLGVPTPNWVRKGYNKETVGKHIYMEVAER